MDAAAYEEVVASEACSAVYCDWGECVITSAGPGCLCDEGFVARPQWWDYQAKYQWQGDGPDELSVLLFGFLLSSSGGFADSVLDVMRRHYAGVTKVALVLHADHPDDRDRAESGWRKASSATCSSSGRPRRF